MEQIIKGFWNLSMKYWRDKNHPIEKEAIRRLVICNGCEKRRKKDTMNCPVCGCYLPSKTRSESHCPDTLW